MSIQYAMLGLLKYKPMAGYDIKKLFEMSIGNFWSARLSQIYRELGMLEGKGCLTSTILEQLDRPNKRIYSITNKGREVFDEWIKNFPQQFPQEIKDEFTLRVFFGSNLSKKDLIEQFKNFIQGKNTFLEKLDAISTEKYSKEMSLINNEEIYWKFVIRKAYLTCEMLTNWANECMEELIRIEE